MPAALIVPPASEPVLLADLKAHLRLEDASQDAVLARLIAAARAHVEQITRRVLITQTWRVYLDRWPAKGRVALPVAPVRSVAAITLYAADGTPRLLDPELYWLDAVRAPAALVFAPAACGALRPLNGIEIDVMAGHGAAADVPAPLREAILRLAALWAEYRLDEEAATLAGTPPVVAALLAPWRVASL